MKIWVQPGGEDRRVPKETSTARKPAWFQQGVPTQVEHTRYIARRLKDGDLVQVDAPAAQAPATAPVAATPVTPAANKAPAAPAKAEG